VVINLAQTKALAITILVAVVFAALGYLAGQMTAPQTGATVTVTSYATVTSYVTVAQTVTPTTPPVAVPEKITIGLTLGLSGAYSYASTQGLRGIQIAVKWINEVYGGINLGGKKVKIELKYYDDQSNKELVPSLYEQLIKVDKVDFLLGPYGSPLVFVAAPVAEKYGKLMINWMGTSDVIHEQGYKMIVMVSTHSGSQMKPAMEMVKSLDPNAKVAIIYKEDEHNRLLAQGARETAKQLGLQVVFDKSYPVDIKDFTPIFTEMATYKPDVIVICPHEADGILAATQLAELNINAKLMIMGFVPSLASFKKALGNLAEGWAGTNQWSVGASYTPDDAKALGYEWFGPTEEEVLNLYKQIAPPEDFPSEHTGAGAAAVLILAKAIEKAQSLDPQVVRNTLNTMKVMTFYGPFQIDPTTGKQIAHKEILSQWQQGKFVPIWPPEIALSKPVYPIPTWDEKRQGKQAVPP